MKCNVLLKFQGDETYIYNYDSLGRVTDVILPTGEKLKLLSDLSDDEGLLVKVSAPLQALSKGDKQRIVEFEMKNEKSKMLTITDGMYFNLFLLLFYFLYFVNFVKSIFSDIQVYSNILANIIKNKCKLLL